MISSPKLLFGHQKKSFDEEVVVPTVNFDLGEIVFSPGMAKRALGNVFDTAPIIQGLYEAGATPSDTVTVSRGTQINGNYYENLDTDQGSIVFWITPEWDGGTLTHYIFDAGPVKIYQSASNLTLIVNDSDGTDRSNHFGIGGWTAGTTYCVVASWDKKNKIDGTNYCRISVNDVHDYGMGSSNGSSQVPSATMYVGSNSSGQAPANALIEGFTIYRRVLFDGTYGVDIGNGTDEIAEIYAAGAGKDPCLVTGSWDVVFCLPTDQTAGEIVTGTGEAWSHPHSSAILNDTFMETAYAGSAWGNQGTPVVPYSLEGNGTSTDVNCGSGATIDDLTNGAMTIDFWVRPDAGTNTIIMIKGNFNNTGWSIYHTGNELRFRVQAATTDSQAQFTLRRDNRWHHIACTYDDGGDRKARIYLDGVFKSAGIPAVGLVGLDAAETMWLLARNGTEFFYKGALGYARFSDVVRWTSDFVPPSRLNPPAPDGNTMAQYDFRDGAGATLTDGSGNANHGTIANGTWNIDADQDVDCPGQRIFNWGYVIGADAVNEGITQYVTGTTAGQNYVMRVPLQYEDRFAKARIEIYDAVNGAVIVDFDAPYLVGLHDGGNNASNLSDSGAPTWPQSLIGATVYNITDGSSAAITAIPTGTFVTATLAGGTDNDWDNDDQYMIVPDAEWVFCEPFCFELPTVARNGVAADCVAFDVRIINAGTGTFYVHQAELQENLIDNPSLETGAGNPWIPDGWTNAGGLVAGETSQELNVIHAGSSSLRMQAGGVNDAVQQTPNVVQGAFYGLGIWMYETTHGIELDSNSDAYDNQYNMSTPNYVASGAFWKLYHGAVRGVASGIERLRLKRDSGSPCDGYFDDVHIVSLDDVSLTITPASEANSLESGGIRVDGYDNVPQTPVVNDLEADRGKIRGPVLFRHAAADLVKYGNSNPIYMYADGDATNYIRVYVTAANTIRLEFNDGGGVHTVDWDCTGLIVADTEYLFEVEWWDDRMELIVDSATVVTITQPILFATIPTIIYWGSDDSGEQQIDAVFKAPA